MQTEAKTFSSFLSIIQPNNREWKDINVNEKGVKIKEKGWFLEFQNAYSKRFPNTEIKKNTLKGFHKQPECNKGAVM